MDILLAANTTPNITDKVFIVLIVTLFSTPLLYFIFDFISRKIDNHYFEKRMEQYVEYFKACDEMNDKNKENENLNNTNKEVK